MPARILHLRLALNNFARSRLEHNIAIGSVNCPELFFGFAEIDKLSSSQYFFAGTGCALFSARIYNTVNADIFSVIFAFFPATFVIVLLLVSDCFLFLFSVSIFFFRCAALLASYAGRAFLRLNLCIAEYADSSSVDPEVMPAPGFASHCFISTLQNLFHLEILVGNLLLL